MTNEWIAFWISALLFVGYGYHFIRAWMLYHNEHSVRALRNLYIALMIEVAMVSITFGALGRSYPPAFEFARFVGYMVRGMLLVGGVFVVLSWHVARDIHSEPPKS